ncbi:MAG: hypothetical protein MR452_07940 [Faecalibacterium prausnitzii]|nr:hypothetical protein [Faecalibacterium prausnitzii]
MKKRLLAIFITVIALVPFILSVSAFSDDEALARKRAYYAGIESTLSLLSRNLGTLENVQIQKIVVSSPKDFTTETDVKEFTVSQSQKAFALSYIKVYVQFSASENGAQQDYLFDHYLSFGSDHNPVPLTASEQSESGSNQSIYYNILKQLDSGNGRLVAPGIAYYAGDYHLDIDLSDYQNTGHSFSIPLQQSDDSTIALFPLIRKRAYYRNVEQGLSLLGRLHADYGLSNVQVKRIIVASSSDCTSEADVDKALEAYANKRLKFSPVSPVEISILYSASDGNNTQDYVFSYDPSAPSTFSPNQFSSSPDYITIFLTSFNNIASYFNNYSDCLAPGIAYSSNLGRAYYLDIDLNDYQSSGYSLAI